MNRTWLDERNYVAFDLFNCPSERGAHPIKFDWGKWLEVEHNGTATDQVREIVDVWYKMNVDVVASLLPDNALMWYIHFKKSWDNHVQNNEQEDREQI